MTITTGGSDSNTPLTTNKVEPVRLKVQGRDHGLNIEVIVEPNGEKIIAGYVLGELPWKIFWRT